MIQLDKNQFHLIKEPLSKVSINTLFAQSVVEHCIDGIVYVDKAIDPKTFYVIHPYGLSLLFGDHDNKTFNRTFKQYALNINKSRDKNEWMQAYPTQWNAVLKELFLHNSIASSENINNSTTAIEVNTRLNFRFNKEHYLAHRKNIKGHNLKIERTDRKVFNDMKGSVIPAYFWNDADHFFGDGIGFSLFQDGILASTAYSAFIHDMQLEIGIETIEAFRGKGYAYLSCSALIDYCIENGFEPIWSCRLENIGSYILAQKLGFEVTNEMPFYTLCK